MFKRPALTICAAFSLVSLVACGTANLSAELPQLDNQSAAPQSIEKPPQANGQAALGSNSGNATASPEPAVPAEPAIALAGGAASSGQAADVSAPAADFIVGFRKTTVVLFNDELGNQGARVPVTALSVPIKIRRVATGNGRFLISTVDGPRWVAASEVVKSGAGN
ncbi:MAG: hypothetical protein KJ587_18460 [Alphaproteobacteria bacterium]|nr:hypothetical protein [Alphaproteobacteria bacterium]